MKILFITPETSRTGAPIVLLHLLKWMLENEREFKIEVLSLSKGSLNEEFVKNSHVFYDYESLTLPKKASIVKRILLKLGIVKSTNEASSLFSALSNKNFDIIYSNTVKSIPIAKKIIKKSVLTKHVAHIHELDVIIRHLLPKLKDYMPVIDKIIVPSDLVKKSLIENWNLPKNKIERVYECTAPKKSVELTNKKDTFHVGGSGTVHWRKGYDIFIQVAYFIKKHYPEIKISFTWVGKMYALERLIIEEDLRKLNLTNIVEFVGEVEDPLLIYNTFDVFLMPSREDPFPLVCIEVGMLGKPIICFENATGSSEIFSKKGGYEVPYLDVQNMSEKVMQYLNNPRHLKEHGEYNKIAFSKFIPSEICPKLVTVIKAVPR